MSEAIKQLTDAASASKRGCCGGGDAEGEARASAATHAEHECCGHPELTQTAQSSCGCSSSQASETKARGASTK